MWVIFPKPIYASKLGKYLLWKCQVDKRQNVIDPLIEPPWVSKQCFENISKFTSSVLVIPKQCPYLKTHWRSSQLKRTKFGPLMVSFTRCKLFRVVSLCVYKQHVLCVSLSLLKVKSCPLQKRRREKHVKTWPFWLWLLERNVWESVKGIFFLFTLYSLY